MTSGFGISPDLRGLLGELAEDETARLLRVSHDQGAIEAHERRPRIAVGAASLQPIERQLLSTHREETGRLLYRLAALEANEAPTFGAANHYADGSPLPTRNSLESRIRALPKGDENEDSHLLRACLNHGRVAPIAILAAAARLTPSASIRVCQANCLFLLEDDAAGAARLYRSVVEEESPVASYAWEGLGAIAAAQGRYERTAHCNREAVRLDPARAMPKLAWLRFAFLAGSAEQFVEAARLVDSELQITDPAVTWYLSMGPRGNAIHATEHSVRMARRLEDRLGTVSRAVTGDGHEA